MLNTKTQHDTIREIPITSSGKTKIYFLLLVAAMSLIDFSVKGDTSNRIFISISDYNNCYNTFIYNDCFSRTFDNLGPEITCNNLTLVYNECNIFFTTCVNKPLTFTPGSQSGTFQLGQDLGYLEWVFPAPSSCPGSTTQQTWDPITCSFNISGNFWVALNYYLYCAFDDNYHLTHSVSVQIIVNAPPVITLNILDQCQDPICIEIDESSQTFCGVSYVLSDPFASAHFCFPGGPTCVHQWCANSSNIQPGTYTVTATAFDGTCSATATATVTFPGDPMDVIPVTGTQTWDACNNPFTTCLQDAYFNGTITIEPGANLTIDNMVFHFGANAKVIVKPGNTTLPGGRLTLHGTTLTANAQCQTMWQGVEVWGNPATDDPSAQGKITLVDHSGNHSSIEYAVRGIVLGDAVISSHNGGIVDANNAEFINNVMGIFFYEHNPANTNSYESHIDNCDFISVAPYLWAPYTGQRTGEHIFMYNMDGSQVLFGNNNYFLDADFGIALWNTSDVILSAATFDNCGTGFASARWNITSTNHTITSCHFNDDHTAIAMYGGISDEISNNQFNTTNPYTPQTNSNNFFGIFMENCQDLQIGQNNHFKGYSYGIYVNTSSATEDGDIWDNTFTGCWRAIHTRPSSTGVQIKCNEFSTSNTYNYSTQWYIGHRLGDQLPEEFGFPMGAGNTFDNTHSSPNDKDLYSVDGNPSNPNFHYNYFSSQAGAFPQRYTLSSIDLGIIPFGLPSGYCTNPPQLMELADDDPETAESIIDTTSDEEQQRSFINQLVVWYNQHAQVQDAIDFLEPREDEPSRKLLLSEYFLVQQHENAQTLLDEYAEQSDDESQNYYLLNQVILDWAVDDRKPEEMTSVEQTTLFDVKESGTTSSVQAGSILRFVLDTVFIESNYEDTSLFRVEMAGMYGNVFLQGVYPNPVTDASEIVYFIPDDASFTELNIYDVTGRKVFSRILNKGQGRINISADELSDGAYIIELNLDNVRKEHQKMIVQSIKK